MHKITIVLGKCKWYVMMQCNLRASRNSLQQPAPLAEQESGQESAWDAPTAATRALAAASTSGGCALQLVCADQNESYVGPSPAGDADPAGGPFTGNGELETYALARYWCGEYAGAGAGGTWPCTTCGG